LKELKGSILALKDTGRVQNYPGVIFTKHFCFSQRVSSSLVCCPGIL